MEDHMSIGSGLIQLIISNIVKKYIRKKLGKTDLDFAFIFNSPLKLDNDGENVNLDVNIKIAMSYKDLMTIMKNLEI